MKRLALLPALAASLCWISPSHAETKIGFRQLVTITPTAVQRGTSAEVKLRSNFTLDETYAAFFDEPGITMTFLETKPIEAPRRGRGREGTPFRFRIEVPADQMPRVYECRVATRQAVSSVTHLLVTDFPVVSEEEKDNGSRKAAQSVAVPSTVSGICERSEDVDFYRISAKAGQSLTFEIYAQRVTEAIHSMQTGAVYLMDPILTLYDADGRLLAQNDNFLGAESFLAFTAPADGDYFLEVRDARYIGNPKYVYCVEISDRPFVHATFPMAVQQGIPTEAELIGHGLGDATSIVLKGPAQEQPGWQLFSFETPAGRTNPVPVLVSPHPQVVAQGGNTSFEKPQALELPVGVSGQFAKPDEAHYFSFDAKKGRYYLFEVQSDRFGLPFDSIIEIHNADGRKLSDADDGLQTQDAKLYFRAPADGQYVVRIADLHGRAGDRFTYHLRAEPSGPDFEVHGEYYYAQIAPGTRMMWFIRVKRLNGFDGPVEIGIEDLPKGVTFEPVTIPSGMDHCGLILSAAPDAEINASLVRVYGKAALPGDDGQPVEAVRYGRITCELQTRGGGQARWPIKTQLVGVTKPLDLLKVEATPTEVTLKPGEKAEIRLRIERNKDFKDPVTLATEFMYFSRSYGDQLPPGVTMSKASTARLTGDALEGTIILEAGEKALPVERLPIGIMARVSITFSITTNYSSNPIYLTIPANEKVAKK